MKKGWEIKTLGEVCQFINRGICPKYMEAGGACVLNQKCVKNQTINFSLSRRHDVTAKKISPERILRYGDVLINSTGTGTLGRVAQLLESPPEVTTVDSHVTIVRPINNIFHPSFFGYAIIAIEEQLQGAGEGCGGQTELARTKLASDFTVRYPTSISEQQRIVAILDEAFEGIAKAKANTEQNLKNARELFESHLQAVFSQRGEGWVEERIGDHIRFIDYRGKTPTKTQEGVRLITAKNIKMGYLQEYPKEYVAPESYSSWMIRGVPRKGDILFTTEAPLANIAQLDTDERVVFAQRVIIMQPEATIIDSSFLKYLLMSKPVQAKIHMLGTGATVKGIKASLLKSILVSFPEKLSEQKNIVSVFDKLLRKTQRLESIYQRKIAALDELKKSLLHKAFSGEL